MNDCPHAVRCCQVRRNRRHATRGATVLVVAIVVAVLAFPTILLGDATNVFSPAASYQYPDGIVVAPTVTFSYPEGMSFARVVSYQYTEGVALSAVVSYYYQFVVDSVGDGIPDLWRQRYFGGYGTTTNSLSCATCDPDSDGMNNWQEYVAGTDPTNINSIFRFTSAETIPSQGIVVRWPSIPNRFYDLTRATNLLAGTNAFVILPGASNMPATPTENIYTDAVQGVGPYFFKIDVHE